MLKDYLTYIKNHLGVAEFLLPVEPCGVLTNFKTPVESQSSSPNQAITPINVENPVCETVPAIAPPVEGIVSVSTSSAPTSSSSSSSDFTSSIAVLEAAEASFRLHGGQYEAIFLRVTDGRPSLGSDSAALELFLRLRKALDLDGERAPWVECQLANWTLCFRELSKRSSFVLIMTDDLIHQGTKTPMGNDVRVVLEPRLEDLWVIPDPAWLIEDESLKRPTWELLKDWKKQLPV